MGILGVALVPFLLPINAVCKYNVLLTCLAFWILMGFYLVAFTFMTYSQSLVLNILSGYDPKYTGSYLKF